MDSKLIKSIATKRYIVELIEVNDKYIITYENNSYHGINYSEQINDFKTASFLFDLKIEELDGQ